MDTEVTTTTIKQVPVRQQSRQNRQRNLNRLLTDRDISNQPRNRGAPRGTRLRYGQARRRYGALPRRTSCLQHPHPKGQNSVMGAVPKGHS
jgi:hypothetical protein